MSIQMLQTASTVAQLAIALWLYASPLRRRRFFLVTSSFVFFGIIIVTTLAMEHGFTLFPTLTDNLSFVRAVASFLAELLIMTLVVMMLWDCSPNTALFCSSSAYLLQNVTAGLDRTLHLTGIVRPSVARPEAMGLPLADTIVFWSAALIVFGAFYLLLGHRLTREGLLATRSPLMLFAVVLAMAVSIIFDLIVKDLPLLDIPWRYPVMLSFVQLATCLFILLAEFEIIYGQRLRESVSAMERVVSEQERQYALSQQTIEAINRRVHNMRHHVFSILTQDENTEVGRNALRQIAHELQVYDSRVKTGNVALDVVLTEKGLLCSQEGVALTCIADGHILDFMAASDIYTLFGTAVDGAIEAVRDTGDASGQAISLNVRNAMGMAAVSVEHYLVSADMRDPQREAAGKRRLDTMRTVVERYGGTLALENAEDGVFHLDALIPIP